MRNKKFTIIELLVVLVVIAILISILLPSLNSARDKALIIKCKSNLKQIGIGVFLYANDNEQYMPTSNIGNSSNWTPGLIYYTSKYLSIEMNSSDDYRDTDVRGTVFDEPVLNGDVNGGYEFAAASGYGWNWQWMGYKQTAGGESSQSKKIIGVIDASESMLAADGSENQAGWRGHKHFRYRDVGDRHGGKINVLFADGHVDLEESVPLRTSSNSKWWYGELP